MSVNTVDLVLPGCYTCPCGRRYRTETIFEKAQVRPGALLGGSGQEFGLVAQSVRTEYYGGIYRVLPRKDGVLPCLSCQRLLAVRASGESEPC